MAGDHYVRVISHESPFVYERKSSIADRERPDDQWSAGLDTAVFGSMLHPLVCFLLFDDSAFQYVSSLFSLYSSSENGKISLSFAEYSCRYGIWCNYVNMTSIWSWIWYIFCFSLVSVQLLSCFCLSLKNVFSWDCIIFDKFVRYFGIV